MTAFAAPRQQALAYFFAWVPLNLRPYDEVAVLDFAGTAAWTLRPTSVDEIAQGRHTLIDPGVVDQTSTNLRPVLERVAALPFTPARTSVWLFSDGQYGDYPDHETDARHVLAEAGVTTLPLLVPDPTITVPTRWSDCFSREVLETFHGLDPHETALALGHATAATTRQHLTRTS